MTSTRLTTDPGDFATTFSDTFNRRNLDEIVAGYTPDAVLNLGGGIVLRGHSEIRVALADFLAPGLPMTVTPGAYAFSGDTALAMFDWVIEGPGPDGRQILMRGSAVDVLARGDDGYWRQLLDCPFGSGTVVS